MSFAYRKPSFRKSSCVALGLLLSTAMPAHALEGRALFEKLLENAQGQVKWEQISEQSSDSFSIAKLEVTGPAGQTMTMDAVTVQGLRETADGRITFDNIALSSIAGDSKNGSKFALSGIVAANADLPYTIWQGGLTAEEKRQRIKFGNFSVSGVAIDSPEAKVTLDTMTLANADIPLDYRFDQNEPSAGDPAAPLTFDVFALAGLAGSTPQGITWGIGSITLNGVNFPTSMAVPVENWMQIYKTVSVSAIKAAMGGNQVFSTDSITARIDPPEADGTTRSFSTLDGMNINLKAIPEPQAQAVIDQLGYETLEASMSGSGSYNPNDGRMEVKDLIMKFKDMANLSLNYVLTGYTREVANAFTEAQLEMATGKNAQEAFASLLPQLSQIKLSNLKIDLTDQSLTGRLLDFQAKQMGTTGDQLAAGAPMMLGLGMGSLGMPAFTDMVTGAVATFLKDKGTLSVEAAPGEPVPIVNVVLAGQSDPTKVPDLLGLKISAQ